MWSRNGRKEVIENDCGMFSSSFIMKKNREQVDVFISLKKHPTAEKMKEWNNDMVCYFIKRWELLIDNDVLNMKADVQNENSSKEMDECMRVNERQMQTTMEKVDTSKALDASSVSIESNGTESQKQDTNSRSVNDVDIRPIYDEEPKAEVQLRLLRYSLKYRYIVQSYKGRTRSLVTEKTDISKNKASRNFDLMINIMTSVHISSGLVFHQMTSDHNCQNFGITAQAMTRQDSKRSKSCPLAQDQLHHDKELEFNYSNHHIAMLEDNQVNNTKSENPEKFRKRSLLDMSLGNDKHLHA
ncbi:hypothetical protein Tco_0860293 [Tanacetum coccineum]|uniref:Protein FAR1-RELATED SEQUENCE n=1 Tax=Tanacetum coccineum TaxID=301880 RepID=A0ABQ5BEG6_9ASTR